jgi:hypothetical protein
MALSLGPPGRVRFASNRAETLVRPNDAFLAAEGASLSEAQIFQLVKLDASLLPPHEEVLAWLNSSAPASCLRIASLSASAAIATLVPRAFISALIAYLVLTSLYSLFLKRFLVIDVLVFALLYTLRVIAGHLATGIPFSLWVLSCAFFLFLILAYGKRDQI